MTPFPRPDYDGLARYEPDRRPVEVDLSDNTNLWGTHPAALERIRAATTDDLARYPELYADVLRHAVADRFAVAPECVTTGAGSDDVLDSAFRAAFQPGATMTFPAPTFSMVEPLARMNGIAARAVSWPDAFDEPSLLLEGRPDLVYVCRPNNPTGEQVPEEWLERVLGFGRPRKGYCPLIIVDEAYADFAGETVLGWAPRLENLLVTRTASKAYGLAGLRCGFAVGRARVVLEVEKSRGPYKVALLAAEAAAAAVRDEDGWMATVGEECVANRERLFSALTERGLTPFESRANFLLFAAPTGSAHDDARALHEEGIGVRPFTGIAGFDEGLRVTVGPWQVMERFLTALDVVCEAAARTPGGSR